MVDVIANLYRATKGEICGTARTQLSENLIIAGVGLEAPLNRYHGGVLYKSSG